MTSGVFSTTSLGLITIPERQRRDLGDISQLADSISRLGLIHPIVLDRELVLVAGERRLTAVRSLGWTSISFQYIDDLSDDDRHLIELEENSKRLDLTWQEHNDAIARYHEIRLNQTPNWTSVNTAAALGTDTSTITKHLQVKKERNDPNINNADTFRTAIRKTQAILERRAADEGADIYTGTVPVYIQHTSFHTWAPAYSGPKFNLIHCDFPYGGISMREQSAPIGRYEDTEDIYWELMKTLSVHLDNFCAESAHMIFWFSPIHYAQTWENLKLLDGFVFDEHPLVWSKGNVGIAPDTLRRPRRVHETAFFGWRGDRKLIRLRTNVAVHQPSDRVEHPHEKSENALAYFFSMLVDAGTRLLDPTAGSGTALLAASSLGAGSVFGLESDAEFCRRANDRYQRRLREGFINPFLSDDSNGST